MNKFGGEAIPSKYVETVNEEYKTRKMRIDDEHEIVITIYDKKTYNKYDKDVNGINRSLIYF